MKKEVLEECINEGLNLAEIGERFGISRQAVCRWKSKYGLVANRKKRKHKNLKPHLCKCCGTRDSDKFKYGRKSLCVSCSKKEHRRNAKLFAIEYKGGKCFHCGYDNCSDALEFHHINPDDKHDKAKNLLLFSKVSLKKELDKCIMLCSNCHREEHFKLRQKDLT